jgi:hypothetical protein
MNKVYSRRLSISNQLEDIEALQVSKPCHSHSFPSIIYIPYHSYKKDFTETQTLKIVDLSIFKVPGQWSYHFTE